MFSKGKKTAAIVPFDEWERIEAAKKILEHVYLDGTIKERRNIRATINLDDLLGGGHDACRSGNLS